MPSAVVVGNQSTRVPGVYAETDTSRLSGRAIDLNILGVVAELPFLEQAKPVRVGTAAALRSLAPTNSTLLRMTSIIYKASVDAAIEGAPSAVVVCSPVPTTRALLELASGSDPVMTVYAKAWGSEGNKTRVEYTKTASVMTFLVSRNGASESHVVPRGNAITVTYTGTEAATMTVANDPDDGLVIVATVGGLTVPGTYVPSEMAFDGKLTLSPDVAPGAGETTTLEVKGVRKDTGLLWTEVLTWLDDDAASKETQFAYSAVQQIASTTTGATTEYDLLVDAFSLQVDEYANAALAADRIDAFNAQGFGAVKVSPRVAKVPLNELDAVPITSIKGTVVGVPMDLWALLLKLASSTLVEAERYSVPATPYTGASPPDDTTQFLVGGTQTTPTNEDWGKADEAMRTPSVQILWVQSTEASVRATFDAHCIYMAGKGANERNVWLGLDAQATKDDIDQATGALNSRHSAVVFQEASIDDWDGRRVRVDPNWYALFHAAMQAGTRPGVALTRKRPRIYGVWSHPTVDPKQDEEELLQLGVCTTQEDDVGFRVLRSITTYRADDNRVLSEVSTNESVNTSVRDLREELDFLVGDTETTAGRVLTLAKAILRTQVDRQIIKWLDVDSVEVTDDGDVFVVRYEFAPIEPKNFIIVQASAVTQVVVAAG